MPDKRPLDGPDGQPPSKRPLPTPASSSATMSNSGVIAVLQHPRRATGSSSSPFASAPPFQQPSQLCSFSFDSSRTQWHDDRSKKYYRGPPPYNNRHPQLTRAPPVFGADLNHGLDRFTRRDESTPEHLDALVSALQHRTESAATETEREERDSERRKADVITWRGIVTKICTAYEQDPTARFADALELNAMVLDGTLYLEEYTSGAAFAEKQKKEDDPKMLRLGYYGYAFESYCTVDTAEEVGEAHRPSGRTDSRVPDPPGWSGDVNTNVQWCSIVKTKLGDNRLIIGGEVDAVSSHKGVESLIELKTSMQITPAHRNPSKAAIEQERFERKLLKFFLQSYLLGIGKIVVGFRDHHGLLTTHQEFDTLRIPRMVRAGLPIAGQLDAAGRPAIREKSVWEPKDGLGWGDEILSFVRKTVQSRSDKEGQVFRVTYKSPFEAVEIRALSQQQAVDEAQDGARSGERVGFLPRSFYDFVRSRAEKAGGADGADGSTR